MIKLQNEKKEVLRPPAALLYQLLCSYAYSASLWLQCHGFGASVPPSSPFFVDHEFWISPGFNTVKNKVEWLIHLPEQLLPPVMLSKSPKALEDLPTTCLQVSTVLDFQVWPSPWCLLLHSDCAQSLSEEHHDEKTPMTKQIDAPSSINDDAWPLQAHQWHSYTTGAGLTSDLPLGLRHHDSVINLSSSNIPSFTFFI